MFVKHSQEKKDEIVAKIKSGEKVANVASQYGISTKTIYYWLRADTGEEAVSVLKYNKLKRENEELKRLIGELTLDLSLEKKVELVTQEEIKAVRAAALGISRKNVYRHLKRPEKDRQLVKAIKEVWRKHSAYGQYKMALYLGINHKRAERVMKENHLKAPRRKNRHYCTVSTYHHTYTNIIKELNPAEFVPHLIWVCGVSFFKFQQEFWYLATIEDLATRQILAAQVGRHHDALLILRAIKQAKLVTQAVPTFFHSDPGTEFMAQEVTGYLELQGVKVSVSAKASPWENGYKESFFGHFKDEFGDINRFETVGQLVEEIYSPVHYYNYERIHRSLKMPPVQYALHHFPEYCLHKRGT